MRVGILGLGTGVPSWGGGIVLHVRLGWLRVRGGSGLGSCCGGGVGGSGESGGISL